MFKAHQKLMVLWELAEKERSGYDLIKHLGEVTSSKPSPGYIYPLLHGLKSKGLASSSVHGRKTTYSITPKGKKLLDEMRGLHARMAVEMGKSIEAIGGKKEAGKFLKLSAELVEHGDSLLKDSGLMQPIMESVIRLHRRKDFKDKRQQLRDILKGAAEKIKGLAKD
ncbi:MAG TPA: PadR family transcriptional regulator [Nanoarchaeota archaeon]|nr:PadR family transcriptional regulator [Nanoarchaeota archaeon]